MSARNIVITDDKGAGLASPAASGAAVTPSNDDDLAKVARLYVGVTGDISVILANDADGAPVLLKNVPVGYQPLLVRRVRATGTTATQIVALFV